MYFNDCELIIVIKIAAMIKVCFFLNWLDKYFMMNMEIWNVLTDCNLFKNDVKLYSL